MVRTSTLLPAGAAALCGAHLAFVQPAAPAQGSVAAPRLRAGAARASAQSGSFAGALPAASAVAIGSVVACRAAATKKKGVKVVHGKEIPWNIFMPKAPYTGKVVKNDCHPQTITSDTGDANWETTHLTFDHGGKVPYLEGQSIGVIAPGPDKKGETPAKIRLYSIASSAVGDCQDSKTVSLCVKRVVDLDGKFANREVGEDKPDKAGSVFPKNKVYRGVCSNHICDMSVGDDVLITGPTGAEMLLPDDPNSNIIMLATGTGIAPMRSYMRLLFHDKVGQAADGSRKFQGLAWLFMGVPYSKSLLYDDEHTEYVKNFPGQFKFDYAVSREDKNAAGQKMYIQTKMAEYTEELWALMQKENTHIYMCGLKGMEAGMEECFSDIASKNGLVWKEFAKAMKKADRYHVEVY
jgi:ferredoxin--NADP+ reductase